MVLRGELGRAISGRCIGYQGHECIAAAGLPGDHFGGAECAQIRAGILRGKSGGRINRGAVQRSRQALDDGVSHAKMSHARCRSLDLRATPGVKTGSLMRRLRSQNCMPVHFHERRFIASARNRQWNQRSSVFPAKRMPSKHPRPDLAPALAPAPHHIRP